MMVVLHDPVVRRAALNDDTPIALTLSRRMPEERVGACVRGVMEHPVERGGVDRAPLHVALDTPRELPTVGAEVDDDLAERSELGIEVENPENRFLHPADRKSTRLNSSHVRISYAVFCLKKKKSSLRLCGTCTRCRCASA